MDLSKFNLALFDIFAYLLPGIALLSILSLMETTFLGSSLLSMSYISNLSAFILLIAYYLGHLVHTLAMLLTEKISWLRAPSGGKLSDSVFQQLRERVVKVYEFDVTRMPDQKLATYDTYIFSEKYIIARGRHAVSESLYVRVAFVRSNMVVFALLALVALLSSVSSNGLAIRIDNNLEILDPSLSIPISIISIFIAFIFWDRYKYYTLLRRSSIYVLFMALTAIPT